MTNNEILIKLMEEHGINHTKLADILMLSLNTVRHYTMQHGLTGYRSFTDRNLKILNKYLAKKR